MTTISFIYQNANNEISSITVRNAVNKGEYFQGFCSTSNTVKTFRYDRVIEFVPNENGLIPTLPEWEGRKQKTPKNTLEICFTGFHESDKIRLSELAQNAGMLVRSSVTSNLDILCCGYHAGDKKIEKAKKMQLIILSELELINLLETGEIPTH